MDPGHLIMRIFGAAAATFWALLFGGLQLASFENPWWMGPWFPTFFGGLVAYNSWSLLDRCWSVWSHASEDQQSAQHPATSRSMVMTATAITNPEIACKLALALAAFAVVIYALPPRGPQPLIVLCLYVIAATIITKLTRARPQPTPQAK